MIGAVIGTVLLTGALAYLRTLPKAPAGLDWWAAGFALNAIRYLLYLAAPTVGKDISLALAEALQAINAVFLLAGTMAFLGRRAIPALVATACVTVTAWAFLTVFVVPDFLLRSVPLYAFGGGAMVFTGIMLLRARPVQEGTGHLITGSAFILWGLHKLDYPFLRPVEWFAPIGFILAQGLAMAVALGLIVIVVRELTRTVREELAERERAAAALIESESRLAEAQRIGRMGNWVWEVESGELHWSDEIYRIFGREPGAFEPTYERFMETVHPDDVERVKTSEKEAFAKGAKHSIDHRIVLPDGSVRWVHEEAVATLDPAGAPLRLAGTVQDITERKQAEVKLRHSLTDQRIIAEVSHLALEDRPLQDILRRTLDAVLSNEYLGHQAKGALFLLEQDRNELVMQAQRGLDDDMQTTCARLPVGRCLCGKAVEKGEVIFASHVDERHEITTKDMAPHGHYCVPIRSNEETLGVLSVYLPEGHAHNEDEERFLTIVCHTLAGIIERERAEDALNQSLESLMQSSAELQRFASVAAHDLQEPVRSVIRFAQRVGNKVEDLAPTETKADIGFLVSEAKRIGDLVRDLVTYTRGIDKAVPFEEVDMNTVWTEATDRLEASIEEAEGALSVGLLPRVMGDRTLLLELAQNLINNAVKFRKRGEPPLITVEAHRKDGEWVFAVSDNGIGIEAEYQERIFGIFKRLHTTQAYPGTGVGLAVCRRILERHGGRIWVESKPGRGSTFRFTLPVTETGAEDASGD